MYSCLAVASDPIVHIGDNGATPTLGQSYSLPCEVTGASDPIISSAYQWRKNGTVINTGPTLSFSSLRLSDAGQYTCQVTVDRMMLSSTKVITLTS